MQTKAKASPESSASADEQFRPLGRGRDQSLMHRSVQAGKKLPGRAIYFEIEVQADTHPLLCS